MNSQAPKYIMLGNKMLAIVAICILLCVPGHDQVKRKRFVITNLQYCNG